MPEFSPLGNAIVRDALEQIYAEYGYLDADLLVEVASDRRHVLHSLLTWDNKLAGHKWRLNEARQLIRSIKVSFVTDQDTLEKVRSWHVVRAPDRNSYRPLEEIAEDPFQRQLVQRDMERRWRQLFSRYKSFSEFVDMVRRDLDGDDGEVETG